MPFHIFFSEARAGTCVPRELFPDLEPTVRDGILAGKYNSLFHPEQLLSIKEDAANNHAWVHNSVGSEIMNLKLERIQKLAEHCSEFKGFLIFWSFGESVESGFISLLMVWLLLFFF